MQVQKTNIRQDILSASQRLFTTKGYRATTTREIAEGARITLSNLYRYFPSKDALFCTLVSPVTNELERVLNEHHGIRGTDILQWNGEEYLEATVQEYMNIIVRHRALLKILVLGAGGSSLEHYKEHYVNKSTSLVTAWMNRMQLEHPNMRGEVSDFFVLINNVWLFTLIEEVLRHDLPEDRTRLLLLDYVRFQILGWNKIFSL